MHRTLRESARFSAQRAALFPDTRVWDRVWFGMDVTIAADPESGTPTDVPGVWLVIAGPAPGWGFGRMRVYYTFDDEYIDLRWIEAA